MRRNIITLLIIVILTACDDDTLPTAESPDISTEWANIKQLTTYIEDFEDGILVDTSVRRQITLDHGLIISSKSFDEDNELFYSDEYIYSFIGTRISYSKKIIIKYKNGTFDSEEHLDTEFESNGTDDLDYNSLKSLTVNGDYLLIFGQRYMSQQILWDIRGGENTPIRCYNYENDKNGMMTKRNEYRYWFTDDELIKTDYFAYKYNNDGLIEEMTTIEKDFENGYADTLRLTMEYDAKGRIVKGIGFFKSTVTSDYQYTEYPDSLVVIRTNPESSDMEYRNVYSPDTGLRLKREEYRNGKLISRQSWVYETE